MAPQHLASAVRWRSDLNSQATRQAATNLMNQRLEVFQTLAEGGDFKLDNSQPVVEIRPKASRDHLSLERAIRGGHHPRPHGQGDASPNPLIAAIMQHPQQLGLQVGGQFRHLVQEKCPALRPLKATRPANRRIGESTALVSEEFALDHARRERCAIHMDERGCGPRRSPVKGPGDLALPRPRLAGEENTAIAGRHALDARAERSHTSAPPPHDPGRL